MGQKFVRLLAEHPWFEIAAVAASSASAGKRYGDVVRWREPMPLPERVAGLTVQECVPPLAGPIAFSALDADVAGPIEQAFARAGRLRRHQRAQSPDGRRRAAARSRRPTPTTSRWWTASGRAGAGAGAILANPNCSTAGLVLALAPLHRAFGIEKLFVSTMQAVSGRDTPAWRRSTSSAT